MLAMLAAAFDLSHAEREVREGFRPLARESAARRAMAAEDRFIAARLDAWAVVLSPTPAPVAG